MPVIGIPYQPASAQLMAAYRPIVMKVQASAVSLGGAALTVTGSMIATPDNQISIPNYNGSFFKVGKKCTISGAGANNGDRTVTNIEQIGTTQVIHFSAEFAFTTLANQVKTFTAIDTPIVPPYVVCDIYIEDVYYKSIMRTAAESTTDDVSIFVFDISRDLQEYLQPDIATILNSQILAAPHMSAKVVCRFRSSNINADGFTVEEGTKPIQATKNTEAVSGDGFESNAFFVINAALQHEDNQNLATHLSNYEYLSWSNEMYPLSHRMKPIFCPGDSDHMAVVAKFADCVTLDLKLNYKLKGDADFRTITKNYSSDCETFEYTVDTSGNQVTLSTEDTIPEGYKMFVRYKKQSSDAWITAGTFDTFPIAFYVLGDDFAGDYDIEVYYYCTSCDHSEAVPHTFTLEGEAVSLAWRGITPFCVQQTFETPVYIVLELRNQVNDNAYFPNPDHPFSYTSTTKYDLYAKFYSDAAHLTPVSFTQAGLKVWIKSREVNSIETTSSTYHSTQDALTFFEVDAAGTEVLLGQVLTYRNIISYSPYPTVSSTSTSNFTYNPFPSDVLSGGNTGDKGDTTLQQYNTITNAPTGTTKPNDPEDPDYIAPSADGVTCPAGPPWMKFVYSSNLQISKAEVRTTPGPAYQYGDVVANTEAGGYTILLPQTMPGAKTISIKAHTLDTGNHTGILKVNVGYVDSGGAFHNQIFNITDNVETAIPMSFDNLTVINISNF